MSHNNPVYKEWTQNVALDLSVASNSYSTNVDMNSEREVKYRLTMKDAGTQYEERDIKDELPCGKKNVSTQYEERDFNSEVESPPRKKIKIEKINWRRKLSDINANLSIKPVGSQIGWSAYQQSLKGSFLERLFESPTDELSSQDIAVPSTSTATVPIYQQRLNSNRKVLPPDPFMVSDSLADLDYIPTIEDYEYRDPRQAAKKPAIIQTKEDCKYRDPRLAAAFEDYYEQMRRSEESAFLAQQYGYIDEDEYDDTTKWDFGDDTLLLLKTGKKTQDISMLPKYKVEDDDPPHIFNPLTQMYYPLRNGDQIDIEADIHHSPSERMARRARLKSQSSDLDVDMEVANIMANPPPEDFDEIIFIPATPESPMYSSPRTQRPMRRNSIASSTSPVVGSPIGSSPRSSPMRRNSPAGSTSPGSPFNRNVFSKGEGDSTNKKSDSVNSEDRHGGYEFDEAAYLASLRKSSQFPQRRYSM